MTVSKAVWDLCEIAVSCQERDPGWFREVLSIPDKREMVQDCRARLDRLAGEVHKCSSILFEAVCLREQTIVNGRLEEKTVLTPLWLVATKPGAISGRLNATTCLLHPGDADFYLLHDGEVWHILLSPDEPAVTAFAKPQKDKNIWDLSPTELEKLVTKSWNDHFISAMSDRGQLIPLPKRVPVTKDEVKR